MTEEKKVRPPSSGQRVAAFIAEKGVGEKFKKMELFAAVPDTSQADRRMRDLRDIGWVIDNYKINPNLMPDEYLIREIGVRIDLGEKRPPTRKGIGGPQRRRILERDGHACQVCGAAAGVPFVDEPTRKAQMTMGHIIPVSRGGTDEDSNLRAECQRCNDEARNVTQNPPDPDQVFNDAQNIKGGVKEKKTLYSWMQAGRRDTSNMERIFNDWARLPYQQRLEVMNRLAGQVFKEDAKVEG